MFTKEPTESLDYEIDWADWLGSLTIASSSWSVPSGITQVSATNNSTTTTIRLFGGTWGETYEIFNTITASDGETEPRSILIRIQRSVAYCTTGEVRRRMSGGARAGGSATTTALPPAELEALIEQASRMIDLECGVAEGYFNPAPIPIATSKTFYGNGTNYLQLPPYIPGSLNTTLTLPDGYTAPTFTEKGGFLILNSSGVLPPFSGFSSACWPGWYSGVGITVSAIWGFRETPADIKLAVIELVINLSRETDPSSLKLTNLEGQPLRETLPPRVKEIIRKYRPRTGVAFV